MIARIAAGLAFNSSPENRWRQVVVPVTAGVFTLLLLASTSVLFTLQRELERADERLPVKAAEPAPSDLLMAQLDDVWHGDQFPVWWIEPAADAKPVLPPGMERLPAPGQAVVSPELDRLASNHPRLAQRYPNPLVLEPEGLRSGEELLAYVRMPEGRTFPDSGAVIRASHFAPVGDGGFFEVFGRSAAPLYAYLEGFGALLIVPGLVVLLVGAAAGSSVRRRRFEVLGWLGTKRRTLAAVGGLETVILALPGIVLVSVVWGLVAPRLGRVPLVRHNVVQGDLALAPWILAVEAGVAALMAGLAAVVTSTLRRRRRGWLRPVLGRVSLSHWRWVPLVFGLVSLTLSTFGVGPAANLSLLGVAAIFGGMPLVLPGVVRRVGRRMARLESVPGFLAGRDLSWNPLRAARPLLGMATLIVIALAGVGVIAKGTHLEGRTRLSGGVSTVNVQWVDPQPHDIERLARALDGGTIVPMRRPGHGHEHGQPPGGDQSRGRGHSHGDGSQGANGHSHGSDDGHSHADGRKEGNGHESGAGGHSHGQSNALVLGATCNQLAREVAGAECNTGAPFTLPSSLESKLVESTFLGGPNVDVRLAPRNDIGNGNVMILGSASLKSIEQHVRTAAMTSLPAPYITSALGAVTQRSPLIPWIIGGILAGVLALTVGCLLSLVNHFKERETRDRHLLAIGVTPGRFAWLEVCRLGTAYAATATASFAVGFVVCLLIIGTDTPAPWGNIGITLAVTLLAGLTGMLGMVSLGVRRTYRAAE